MQDFNGKVVVITGAATGIGFALAKQFVSHGSRVVLAARRRNRLDEAATELRNSGGEVRVFECDVTRRDQVEGLAEFAWTEFGQVDVLVNNAGTVGSGLSTVIDAKEEDVRSVMDVNFFGAWTGVSVFGKLFIDQGRPAAIYNMGSENSFFNSIPMGATYTSSKHAMLAMTIALREEVPSHIEVGLICPGMVRSELNSETVNVGMDTDMFAELAMKQMLAGEFFIVSHAYNMVRIENRWSVVRKAYETYAKRYPGDEEFDVRMLGARLGWYTSESKPKQPDFH